MEVFEEVRTSPGTIVINTSIYRQLDVWRALAAIWVVMEHACSTVIDDTKVVSNSALFMAKPYIVFSLSGQLGVIMFFVISGYCIVLAADNTIKRQKTFIDFLKARLRRIYPPYYASIALVVILTLLFVVISKLGFIPMPNHQENFFHNFLAYYFTNLTLTQEIFHTKPIQAIYWSLCFEVAFYFVVAACLFLNQKVKVSLYLMIFLITQVSLIWLMISPTTCPFPFNLWYLFGLGALVYMLIKQPDSLQMKVFLGVSCIMVLAYAYVQPGHYELGHPSTRTQAIFGVIFSLIILFLHRFDSVLMKNRIVKMIAFLGTISYSIYLSHSVIISVPRQLMIKLGFTGDKYWIAFMVQVMAGIVFGYIFHIFCERPFMSSNAKIRESKTTN